MKTTNARRSTTARAVLLAGAMLIAVAPLSAHAQPREFDIPSKSLAEALQDYGRASGKHLLFTDDLVRGKTAPPLKGRYEADEALARLLEGSGLRAERNAAGAIMIRAEEKASAGEPGAGQGPAASAGAEENDREIVVTGSHIRGAAPVGSSLTRITAEDISLSGYSTTEQVIESLPQNFRGGAHGTSADGQFLGSGTLKGLNLSYGSSPNLRGLGAPATLTLLNGRRLAASSNGNYTDISTIPTSAIERVEVLADGASATYGADAVAGVVNIVLKRDFEGIEGRLRHSTSTTGGRNEYRAGLTGGVAWTSGSAMATIDYVDQGNVTVSQRRETEHVPGPATLFPKNAQLSAFAAATQQLFDWLRLEGDLQYTSADRKAFRTSSTAFLDMPVNVERIGGAGSLSADLGAGWEVIFSGSAGSEAQELETTERRHANPSTTIRWPASLRQELWETGGKVDGPLFDLPGGRARIALGYTHRQESSKHVNVGGDSNSSRKVHSVFSEMYLPVVSDNNDQGTLLNRLAISFAVRHDRYSDFGSTTNPRLGLEWEPLVGVKLRGSYGTSFRAPGVGHELQASTSGTSHIAIMPFLSPSGSSIVPVAVLAGSTRLGPEKANSIAFGFSVEPSSAPALRIDGNFYRIKYRGQIVLPPTPSTALQDTALKSFISRFNNPAELLSFIQPLLNEETGIFDATNGQFGQDPLSSAFIAFDGRQTNSAQSETSGLDLSIAYNIKSGRNAVALSGTVTRILTYSSQLSHSSPSLTLLNTVGYPTSWRARAGVTWAKNGLSASSYVNYASSYKDTTAFGDRRVSPYFTWDARAAVEIGDGSSSGLVVALVALNIFNARAPYIANGPHGSNYDSANASPLGRSLSIEVTKKW